MPNPRDPRTHWQPTPPTVQYTMPSLDSGVPRLSPMPDVVEERSRLHPFQYSSRPPVKQDEDSTEDKDTARHVANKHLMEYLFKMGIPSYDFRETTSETNKTLLSASNAYQSHLIRTYNWEFIEGIQYLNDFSIKTALLDAGMYMSIYKPLLLPKDWENSSKEDTPWAPTVVCIGDQLSALNKEEIDGEGRGYSTVKVSDHSVVENLEYPAPSVTLHEARLSSGDHALCIEWTMLKVLGFPGVSLCRSEMDVERHIGSMLAGFFNIKDCITTSNIELRFPTAVECFGSFPKPDFAVRLQKPTIPSCFMPVVLVGEAKRSRDGRITAQLAWTVHPTLVLVIVDSVLRWKNRKNKKIVLKLPTHAFVYGVAYDQWGVDIYSFSPRITETAQDGTPTKWGFVCTPVTPINANLGRAFASHHRATRMGLLKAMLVVQRHAIHLSEELREIELPKEFGACAGCWDDQKPWVN